ncbi:MAG: cation transporter, partial [Dokdonella sp.]
MSECGCHDVEANTAADRRVLWIALVLNLAMAVVGGIAGWIGESTGLLADALDMLSDSTAYAIALAAIGRAARFKANAAMLSGSVLLVLGLGVLAEAGRRAMVGSEPASGLMMAVATLSLIVNMSVLRLLRRFRTGDVHLRASW